MMIEGQVAVLSPSGPRKAGCYIYRRVSLAARMFYMKSEIVETCISHHFNVIYPFMVCTYWHCIVHAML